MTDSSRDLPLPTLNVLIEQVEALHPGADPITHLVDAVVTADGLTAHADHLVGHFVDAARAAFGRKRRRSRRRSRPPRACPRNLTSRPKSPPR